MTHNSAIRWPRFFYFLVVLILATATTSTNADTKVIKIEKCNQIIKLEPDTNIQIRNEFDPKSTKEKKYANNIGSCWFLVEVSRPIDGALIEFNKFHLQEAECTKKNGQLNCCDFLEVGTGLEVGKDSLGKHCGSKLPEPILMENSTFWIKFSTNEQFAFEGFDLTISSFKLSFNEPKGEITSPNLADRSRMKYLNNLDLVYKIVVPEFSLIRLKFLKFDLENVDNELCYDYIEILDSSSTTNGIQLKATGGEKKQVDRKLMCADSYVGTEMVFDTNELYIRLVTDESEQRGGFRILYESIKYIFNEPTGVIAKPTANLNMTYSIEAPIDQKIELSIDEFQFNDCFIRDPHSSASHRMQSCDDSDEYVQFVNEFPRVTQADGSSSSFFSKLNKSLDIASSRGLWKFCSCNKPVRTYLSLTNRLNITYFTLNKKSSNMFLIKYRFVRSEYKENNQLRIVQDQTRSYIGGYLLNVAVPAQNHLRIYGKSAKCSFPNSVLMAKFISDGSDANNSSYVLVDKPINIKWTNFNLKDQCSYLIDLNEPTATNLTRNGDGWRLKWFIKFNNPTDLIDFELSWTFIQNTFTDDMESGTIVLPFQNGFDLTEELVFNFNPSSTKIARSDLSASSNRKYTLVLMPKMGTGSGSSSSSSSGSEESSPIVRTYAKFREGFKQTETLIEPERLFNEKPIEINSPQIQFKLKRSQSWSLDITYKIERMIGDCSFDYTMCNYTINPIDDHEHLISERDTFEKKQTYIAHKAKYDHLDLDQYSANDKLKDFYIAIGKYAIARDVDEVSVYSPLITVQPIKSNSSNEAATWKMNTLSKKTFTLSFDYKTKMYKSNELDAIRVFTVHERSDLLIGQKLNLNDQKKIFVSDSKLSESEPVFYVNDASSCEASTFYKFVKNSDSTSTQLTTRQLDNKPGYYWRHASNIPVYSCFDFRLVFTAIFNNNNVKDSLMEVGVDNVKLDYAGDVEECDSSVCNSNGQCVKFNGEVICCCKPGFEGEKCSNRISACEFAQNSLPSQPLCKNEGTCVDHSAALFDYTCNCTNGFEGKNCEKEINECASNPCQNNAKCIDLIGSYDCVCNEGTEGKNCENKTSECSSKCNKENSLDCIKDGSKIFCKCKPGFKGDDCSIQIDECKSNPCMEGSTCVDLINDFKCECSANLTGKYCESSILSPSFCQQHGHLCQNGSKCIHANENGTSIQCACQMGFTGTFCDKEVNFCGETNPCLNGAECKSMASLLDYQCLCPKGKTGRHCETQLEDVCYKSKCGPNGLCIPIKNVDYYCKCEDGYEGEFCDIQLCNREKHMKENCTQEGTVTVSDECKCVCKQGYSGERCETRKSLCELKKYDCQNGGTCVELGGDEVKCECPLGYFGQYCEVEQDKCKHNKCMHGKCVRTPTGSECAECYSGWKGKYCDELMRPCDIKTDCVQANTESAHSTLGGNGCYCKCKHGFTGSRCETDIDECVANAHKCLNGATCIDKVSTYLCQCKTGFHGSYCEKRMTSCQLKPCNNGTCVDVLGVISCQCNRGYTGKFCETQVDRCENQPCKNGGTCHNLVDDFYCECPRDYGQTKDCSIRIRNPCDADPCMNGGECNPKGRTLRNRSILVANESALLDSVQEYYDAGYDCTCAKGFTGMNCEDYVDPCQSNPCMNGGKCNPSKKLSKSKSSTNSFFNDPSKQANNYKCTCLPKFTGQNCEEIINNCETKTCSGRGKCLELASGPVCECQSGFSGDNCERIWDKCESLTCLNEGRCSLTSAGMAKIPACLCKNSSYTGVRCELDIRSLNITNDNIKASSDSLRKPVSCDILGNDVTLVDYVLTTIVIFGAVIVIITLIYFFVYCNIKKAKSYHKQIIYENRMLNEMNEMSEKYV